jgi:hypothetical protein
MPSKTSFALLAVTVLFVLQFWQVQALRVQVERMHKPEGIDLLQEEEVPLEESTSSQLFVLLESLAQFEENQARFNTNKQALEDFSKDPMWANLGLKVLPQSTLTEDFAFQFITNDGVQVLELTLDQEGLFEVNTYLAALELEDGLSSETVFNQVKTYVEAELPGVLNQIQSVNELRGTLQNTVLNQVDLQNWLKLQGLYFGEEEADLGVYRRALFNADKLVVAELLLYKKDTRIELKVGEESFPLTEVNFSALLTLIQENVDARTLVQKRVDAVRAEIDSLLEDRGFVSTLERLQFSMEPGIETETRIEYPLKNVAGETLSIIFIDRLDGSLKVERVGQSQTLSFALEELRDGGKKKTLYSLPISRLNLA